SALGFDTTTFTGPTRTFENLTIALKHTTATPLSASQTRITTVVNYHSYTLRGTAPYPTTHAFDTPLVGDVISNLVMETCFRNLAYQSSGLANVATTTSSNHALYLASDSAAATLCSSPGSPSTSTARANVKFMASGVSAAVVWSPAEGLFTDEAGTMAYTGGPIVNVYAKPSATTAYTASITTAAGCSVFNEVTVTVLESDPVVLSQDSAVYCQGGSASVQIVSGAEGYTNFVWSPATAVSGDPVSGYVFNAPESAI